MAQGPHPPLRLDPPGRPAERTTGVRLTDTRARVPAGEANQIVLNGIDRWIGGGKPKAGPGQRRPPGYAPLTTGRTFAASGRAKDPQVKLRLSEVEDGGQGQDRTADLPLFSSKDACSTVSVAVYSPALRPHAAVGGPLRTEVNETAIETAGTRTSRGVAVLDLHTS